MSNGGTGWAQTRERSQAHGSDWHSAGTSVVVLDRNGQPQAGQVHLGALLTWSGCTGRKGSSCILASPAVNTRRSTPSFLAASVAPKVALMTPTLPTRDV